MRGTVRVLLAAIACGALAATAFAQGPAGSAEASGQGRAAAAGAKPVQAPKPAKPTQPVVSARRQPARPRSFEISGSAQFLAPGSLGSSPATLTANSGSTPYTYFATSGRVRGSAGIDARATYNLTRRLALEGGFVYSRPQVSFTISNDAEGAPGFTGDGERLSQYFVDGNVLLFLPKLAFAKGRGRGFLEGGAGYLRQLHEGRYNVDTGTVYNGGAGAKYYFTPRPKGVIKAFGLRFDARAYYKRGGFSFDRRNTWTVAFGGGAIVAF